MYLHQKIIRIYADIVQNHSLPGVFQTVGGQVYIGFDCYYCPRLEASTKLRLPSNTSVLYSFSILFTT